MAQAVFDEHPLEEYLRQAGEGLEIMPGSTASLTQELEPPALPSLADTDDTGATESDEEWRPQFLIHLIQHIETLISATQLTKPTNPLVERFKYNVISSSLLSPDLAAPHTHSHTSSRHHSIPGNLPHSRTSSEVSQHQHPVVPTSCPPETTANSNATETQHGLLSALTVVVAVLLSAGWTRIAVVTMWTGFAWIYHLRVQNSATKLADLTPCLETLDELISANNEWESIVQEVVTTLEKDERTASSSSHTSVSSTLRVALNSTLQTTQTQCDNVRHLLSALTSPSELSQLSEMYAPPSPVKPTYSFHDSRRPSSYPVSRPRGAFTSPTTSPHSTTTTFTDHKRMTWNGPHSLGGGGGFTAFSTPSPTMLARRRMRYRSDLSSLLGGSAPTSVASSAPVTPAPSSPLARVSEDTPKPDDGEISPLPDDPFSSNGEEEEGEEGHTSFAAAALKLQRRRMSNGFEVFSTPNSPPSSIKSHHTYGRGRGYSLAFASPTLRGSTFLPSSKFTSIQTSRQPLSLSALRHVLQAAVGAKRYACSHLLALRFLDEDPTSTSTSIPSHSASMSTSSIVVAGDVHYWGDVKSVMELLIGTLSDTSARLSEALREVEGLRLRDQTPTPVGSIDHGSGINHSPGSPDMRKLVMEKEGARRLSGILLGTSSKFVSGVGEGMVNITGGGVGMGLGVSFAPMPSQTSLFAGHVSAIQDALEDARGYLEESVHALKKNPEDQLLHNDKNQAQETGVEGAELEGGVPSDAASEHPALKAYEQLRRELGYALRECERGRNRLLDLVKPPQPLDHSFDHEEGSSEEGVPGLAHDSFSSESDKADTTSPSYSEGVDVAVVVSEREAHNDNDDDASRELLLSADVGHLPPAHAGIEQVFEGDTLTEEEGGLRGIRPKTKLSREERIKLVKARRESAAAGGLGLGLEPSPVIHGVREEGSEEGTAGGYEEKWGPSGDVVQELKDVIWKVGERRRKAQAQVLPQPLLLSQEHEEEEGKSVNQLQDEVRQEEREQPSLLPLTSPLPPPLPSVTVSDRTTGLSPSPSGPLPPPLPPMLSTSSVQAATSPSQTKSRLPSLIVSPRPRPARMLSPSDFAVGLTGASGPPLPPPPPSLSSSSRRRSRIRDSLDLSPRPSAAATTTTTSQRPHSLIPRRPSSMNIQSLLASLEKELPVRKDGEEFVLSSD